MPSLTHQLDDLGNLHDAKIKRLEWIPDSKTLTIVFFEILDPVSEDEIKFMNESMLIVCDRVLDFDMQMDSDQPTVYDCSYEQVNADQGRLTLRIAPGGLFVVNCRMAELTSVANKPDLT